MQIDARLEGSFGDVQGQVPFSETTRANESLRPLHDCASAQALLDTRNHRLWTYLGAVPQRLAASAARCAGGRPSTTKAPNRSNGARPRSG